MIRISDPAALDRCAAEMAATDPWKKLGRDFAACRTALDLPEYEVWGPEPLTGFLVLTLEGSFTGYVRTLCVFPEARGKGVGSLLLREAEERIFQERPNVFICYSSFNPRAGALYRRMGYEQVGEFLDFILPGESEILLRKTRGPLQTTCSPLPDVPGGGSPARAEIRPASEVERLQAAGWMSAQAVWGALAMSPEKCREAQAEHALVALVDGVPRALASYRTSGPFFSWLRALVVEPGWAGRGLGAQLLQAVEEHAFRCGPNLFLGCAEFLTARHFYASQGYQVTARFPDHLAPGVAQLIFRKVAKPVLGS